MSKTDDDLLSAPDSKKGKYQRACLALLRQHEAAGAIPTNGRFIFYELEQVGVVPKHYAPGTKRTPAQDISDALMWLREAGLIPWDWIVDESRDLTQPAFHDTVAEAVIERAAYARIDLWDGEPPPLIVCESRAVKGVLTALAFEYLAPIGATGGQAGGYLVNELAPLFVDNDREVLYIGDHEISGPADQIEDNTRRVLEKHAGREIEWTRIALTQAQVDANPHLADLAIEKSDNRYKPPRKYLAVECEAIGQVELMRLIRDHLDAMLPEPIEDVRLRERQEQRAMVAKLRRMK